MNLKECNLKLKKNKKLFNHLSLGPWNDSRIFPPTNGAITSQVNMTSRSKLFCINNLAIRNGRQLKLKCSGMVKWAKQSLPAISDVVLIGSYMWIIVAIQVAKTKPNFSTSN